MNRAKIFIAFTFLLAFAFQISAQSVQFPNELEGYKFFGNGKLKDLKLNASSKDDVKKIFGANCERKCDYDENWLISFEYFDDIWIKESRNNAGEKLTYKLDSKYLGKLRSIEIRPKNRLSFANISFPETFQKLLLTSTSTFRSDEKRLTGDEAFQDSNGLTYEILNETIKYSRKKTYNKGDLILIRYDIPKELKESLFILQK